MPAAHFGIDSEVASLSIDDGGFVARNSCNLVNKVDAQAS